MSLETCHQTFKSLCIMYNSIEICNFFLEEGNKPFFRKVYLTLPQLQNLVFFSCGIFLAFYNKTLIHESFAACSCGPMLPSLHYRLLKYGFRPVKEYLLEGKHVIGGELIVLQPTINPKDKQAAKVLGLVWKKFGSKDRSLEISRLVKEKGSPWDASYKKGSTNKVISNDLIKQYFMKYVTEKGNI